MEQKTSNKKETKAIPHDTVLAVVNDEPDDCKKEYVEDICDGCPFKETKLVAHPGGDNRYTTESYCCDWGHWEDDF